MQDAIVQSKSNDVLATKMFQKRVWGCSNASIMIAEVDLGDNLVFFFNCNAGLGPDTWPYYETFLWKKNFDLSQITPSLWQITFRTRTSKIQKKNLSYYNFFDFFFQNMITFIETIPKMYNTWGHQVWNPLTATPTHRPPTHHPPKLFNITPWPQVLYIFGIVSTNVIIFWKKKSKKL